MDFKTELEIKKQIRECEFRSMLLVLFALFSSILFIFLNNIYFSVLKHFSLSKFSSIAPLVVYVIFILNCVLYFLDSRTEIKFLRGLIKEKNNASAPLKKSTPT